MQDFPADELEFRLLWTSKASESSTYDTCRIQAEKRAGEAYVRKQDAIAEAMRNLAAVFDALHRTASHQLTEYMQEDERREHEFRSKMKAPRPKPTAERE